MPILDNSTSSFNLSLICIGIRYYSCSHVETFIRHYFNILFAGISITSAFTCVIPPFIVRPKDNPINICRTLYTTSYSISLKNPSHITSCWNIPGFSRGFK